MFVVPILLAMCIVSLSSLNVSFPWYVWLPMIITAGLELAVWLLRQ